MGRLPSPQGAAAPRSISSEVEEGGGGEMDAKDWTSVHSSLASKSLDPSLVSKTVDERFPSKISLDISNNSDLNHRTALRVESAEAGYGRNKVLCGLSMSVPMGSLYALLGPSGCGKTTLLACILARKELSGGKICVMGGEPGDRQLGLPGPLVGFMPQSISLAMEFTIKETFAYFGRLLKLKSDLVASRQAELLHLLQLGDEENRQVRHLSGGQQRRLSLALALLHKPRILVLDEPTVGVDPVMRRRIWEHLELLSSGSDRPTTTIITTHYIEEARGADRVGFMRCGRLLAEDSPESLLRAHNALSLEQVFLNLCQAEDFCPTLSVTTTMKEKQILENTDSPKKERKRANYRFATPSLSNIAALLIKNWITMKRSPVVSYSLNFP